MWSEVNDHNLLANKALVKHQTNPNKQLVQNHHKCLFSQQDYAQPKHSKAQIK
jgi:hypothetical protein